MEVLKYMTYRVLLTHKDVDDRNLNIPEELYDDKNNVYVLSHYAARKYNVLTEEELGVIDKHINNDSKLEEITFNEIKLPSEEEIEELALRFKGHLVTNQSTYTHDINRIVDAIIMYYNKNKRPFSEDIIRKVVFRVYNLYYMYRNLNW